MFWSIQNQLNFIFFNMLPCYLFTYLLDFLGEIFTDRVCVEMGTWPYQSHIDLHLSRKLSKIAVSFHKLFQIKPYCLIVSTDRKIG